MNQKSLVSAIMIFLNDEPFIKDAIASIFCQTYNHWELYHIRLINPNKGGGQCSVVRSFESAHQARSRRAGFLELGIFRVIVGERAPGIFKETRDKRLNCQARTPTPWE